jgi:hypothetical protein
MFVISNQMVILMNRINDCIRRVPVFLEELICLDLLKAKLSLAPFTRLAACLSMLIPIAVLTLAPI